MMVWICEVIISPTVHCMGADLQCYVCQRLLGIDLALSPMNVSLCNQRFLSATVTLTIYIFKKDDKRL